MRILVTGAGGFLGRHLVRRLASAGHEVIALIRRDPPPEHRSFLADEGVEALMLDLARFQTSELPRRVDAVYSLAQSEHFRNFPERAEEIFAVNVTANLRLMQWAATAKVRKFVLASSGGIYGNRGHAFLTETDLLAVDSPLGFYLGTKLCSEVLFQNYRHYFETAAILRPFFIYGPGQRRGMLVQRLIESVRIGKPVHLQGTDGLRLNPVFVEDAAAAFAAALHLPGCHVINVAGPDTLSLREIADRIGQAVGRAPVFESVAGEPSDYVANTDLADTRLAPSRTSFNEGLALTLTA